VLSLLEIPVEFDFTHIAILFVPSLYSSISYCKRLPCLSVKSNSTGISDSADTRIYLYYGNSGASDISNATDVWDSNYVMVQHLNETSGGTDAIKDSTSNNNDGTDIGSPTFGASGQIDGAIDFDGTDDNINMTDTSFDFERTDSFSLSAWIKTDVGAPIIAKQLAGPTFNGYNFYAGASGIIVIIHVTAPTDVTDGNFHHAVLTYDGSSSASGVKVYVDGSSESLTTVTDALTATMLNDRVLQIGTRGFGDFFNGIIDEPRVSNIVRSGLNRVQQPKQSIYILYSRNRTNRNTGLHQVPHRTSRHYRPARYNSYTIQVPHRTG